MYGLIYKMETGVLFMSLYNLKKDSCCVIEKTPEVSLLSSLGVREGVKVRIHTKQPFGGPIIVQVGTRNIALAKSLAQDIIVRKVS
jgi:ferrous iron transport protein A